MDRLDFAAWKTRFVQSLRSILPSAAKGRRRKSIDLARREREREREKATRVLLVRSNWYFNGLAGDGVRKRKRRKKGPWKSLLSTHKRETKELMEATEIHPLPSTPLLPPDRCSVFTAINSAVERIRTRSNAACYNLFKLAAGLFMKKLRRRWTDVRRGRRRPIISLLSYLPSLPARLIRLY